MQSFFVPSTKTLSDCANVQADWRLRLAHRCEGTFSDVAAQKL